MSEDELRLGEAGALLGKGPGDMTLKEVASLVQGGRTLAYRLWKAGCIQGRQPGPGVLFLSRASVLAWRDKTAAPDFWETPEGMRIKDRLRGF